MARLYQWLDNHGTTVVQSKKLWNKRMPFKYQEMREVDIYLYTMTD